MSKEQKAVELKWPVLKFEMQSPEEIAQLETENDQAGKTAVDNIFKKTRDVYGQPPKDIPKKIDWTDYGIHFEHRPSPYDFPAFEHEKNMKEADSIHKHKMEAMEMTAVGGSQEVPSNQKSLLSKDKTTDHVSKSKRIGSKAAPVNPANDAKKEAGSKVAHVKELPGSKKKKRRSAANDMDNCSLEKE